MDSYQKIIDKFLNDIRSKRKDAKENKWVDFLKSELTFPFDAKIEESGDIELNRNDIVKVKGIEGFEDIYGVLVEIRKGRRKYIFPLCDLEITDKNSKNYFIIEKFLSWWAENYF